jgi:hypothetical protein
VLPFRSRRRILAQLGVAGLFSTSAVASAVKASGLSASLSLGAGAGALAAGAAALVATTSLLDPPSPPRAIPSVEAPRAEVVAPKTVDVAPQQQEEEEATAQPAPAPRPPARPADSLSAELQAIEEARAAFAAGDNRGALRLLDAYPRRFPRPRLNTEATVLRIEILVKSGDRDGAATLGKRFLARHAASPYARRVRSLIGDTSAP